MKQKVKNTCCDEKEKKQDEDEDMKNNCKVSQNKTSQNEEMPETENKSETETETPQNGEGNDEKKCTDENNSGSGDLKKSEKEENKDDVIKDMSRENGKLSDENEKLINEIDALKDRLLRITAEYDNFRKRTAKEKEGIYTDACEDVLKNILPVLDNLERANDAEGSLEDLKKGIDMTIKQFEDSLSKLGVEEICTDGEFDPNMHHAVMHIEDKKYKKNQIVEVFQKGYKKSNKILRYSMVKVAN